MIKIIATMLYFEVKMHQIWFWLGALLQILLGELTALPSPPSLAGFKGSYILLREGGREEEMKKEGKRIGW